MNRATSKLWVVVSACGVVAAALFASAGASAMAAERPAEVSPADAQLAENIADHAGGTLMQQRGDNVPSILDEAEALYQAARRLNPAEPRWARYLGQTAIAAGDADTAIEAYKALLTLEPTNRSAQNHLIEIYLSRMETADAKAAYLKDLVAKNAVSEDVRSAAAVRLSKLLIERGQREQAVTALEQGLRLNPLNVEGLALRYRLLQEKGTELERTGALMATLRANPVQPDALWALGRTVAQAGLLKDSVAWFNAAAGAYTRTMRPIPPGLATDYISAQYVGGDTNSANVLLEQAMQGDPSGLDLWLVRLAIQKEQGSKDLKESVAKAVVAASNQLAVLRQQAGVNGATTRPVELAEPLTMPDLSGDMPALDADSTGQLRQAYANVIGDWAWLEVYFAERPEDAQKKIALLKTLLPEGSVIINRLEGWSYLVKGSADEAKVKLSAAADRDPLSAMGLLKLQAADPAAKDRTASEARRLVNQNPAGLLGAILWSGLKGQGVQLVTGPNGDAIAEVLKGFPRELLKLIDRPNDLYAIRAEPVKVSHGYGEPINIRVSLQNLSEYDLTIGPDGVIKPDFVVDARQRGLGDAAFPLAARDQFTQVTVLKARTGISQTVRLDQWQLGDFLAAQPNVSIQFSVGVMTNPVLTQQGIFAAAGGYRIQMPRIIERAGFNIQSEAGGQKVSAALAAAGSAEKIRAIQLLAAYAQGIRHDAQMPEKVGKIADQFEQQISSAASDPSESVQAAAAFALAVVQLNPEQQAALVRKMAEDNSWLKQLMAAYLLRNAPAAMQKDWLTPLTGEGHDPIVRKYAAARLETIAAMPPATQSTTQPASAAPEPTKP